MLMRGDRVNPDQPLFTLTGNTRVLLTGERAALNFLQTLSATATSARLYAETCADSRITILDTRKNHPWPASGAEICSDSGRL